MREPSPPAAAASIGGLSEAFARARVRAAADHPVRVIVLGERHRGDDGVAFVATREAIAGLAPSVAARVEVRETGQLDPADLMELAEGGSAVVVDAVVGVPVGQVVVLALEAVAAGASPGIGGSSGSGEPEPPDGPGSPDGRGASDDPGSPDDPGVTERPGVPERPRRPATVVPRSSHVLAVDQLVALAAALRGAPPRGVLVGLGCERFDFGEPLSPAVAAAVPTFAARIRTEIERLVEDATAS